MTSIVNYFERVERGSEYFRCEVINGKNNNSIGDALWFSTNGSECEIHSDISSTVSIKELIDIFDEDSVKLIVKKFY